MRIACPHCGTAVEAAGYCCAGCEMAAAIIHGAGLDSYYARRDAPPPRPGGAPGASAWGDLPTEAHADGTRGVALHVGGMTCAACAWVTERVVRDLSGVTEATVSPTTGRARVTWDPATTDLDAICTRIAALGYRPRGVASAATPDRDLLLRLGVASFSAMNAMLLSASVYAGWLDGMDPREATLLRWATLLVATPAAIWSAAPILRGAWESSRRSVLSVDLPVAVGIAAMYTHGVWATFTGRDGWLDSMTMLIALLLGGRVLEQGGRRRAVEAAQALAGIAPPRARRIGLAGIEVVPAARIEAGDRLALGLGEQVAADGVVEAGAARVRMALLTGESEPVAVGPGDTLVAGAVVEEGSVTLLVRAAGEDTLVARMAAELARAADRPAMPALADRLAPAFTVGALALAAVGLVGWGLAGDWALGGHVAIAVLVVACPCALALAAPLATAVGLGAAARRGLLVRSGSALARLADVDLVALDKTGTLTLGAPTVVSGDDAVVRIAAGLARASTHPVSRAIVAEAAARGIALPDGRDVEEIGGEGLIGTVDGARWRLGRGEAGTVRLSREGLVDLESGAFTGGALALRDALRPDAARTVAALRARGLRVVLLSGDAEVVAARIGAEAGVDAVVAPARPEEKVAWLRARAAEGRTVLFVGDGVNDGPALAAAAIGVAMGDGAAASVLVADAVVVGEGLAPVLAGLRVAAGVKRAVRAGVLRAVVYNVLTVAAALAGWVNPLVAAVLMPVSSGVAVWGARRVERAAEEPWTR
ncbi:MAG: heavy metal translocating P-type ATPase [Pseudomonadota bacterium]|nr:heavy metal translocating P-type ATPase [Pseudomonadota bacterium]